MHTLSLGDRIGVLLLPYAFYSFIHVLYQFQFAVITEVSGRNRLAALPAFHEFRGMRHDDTLLADPSQDVTLVYARLFAQGVNSQVAIVPQPFDSLLEIGFFLPNACGAYGFVGS